MSRIFKIFGKSPIGPLQEHMQNVYACCKLLTPFFNAVFADDWQLAHEQYENACQYENQADDLKRQLRLQTPQSLLMPIARHDLLELLSVQDHIANRAKDVAGLIVGRKMQFPAPIEASLPNYLKRCIETVGQVKQAIDELDDIIETGFCRNALAVVDEMLTEITQTEHETDALQIDLRNQLFQLEKELPAVDVIFIYKVFEWLGNIADQAQKTGDRLQILLAR